MLIINPGSEVPDTPHNSYERAKATADKWHATMIRRWPEVTITYPDPNDMDDGRWNFKFHHPVTGVTRVLSTHGIRREDQGVFGVRTYWDGSSSSSPQDGSWLPQQHEADYLVGSPYKDPGSNNIESGLTSTDDVTWRAVVKFVPVCICDRVASNDPDDAKWVGCPTHPKDEHSDG